MNYRKTMVKSSFQSITTKRMKLLWLVDCPQDHEHGLVNSQGATELGTGTVM